MNGIPNNDAAPMTAPAAPSPIGGEGLSVVPCSDVFATTLRDIHGMVISIEKGTRVKVTRQDKEDGTCTINLLPADNPTRIWNCIVGVPMKHLQFDPQNATE